jgi:hypothetical protein
MEYDTPSPSRAELSKTPSWVMLGFVLGVLAVLGFQRERSEPVAAKAETSVMEPPPVKGAVDGVEEPARSVTSLEDRPSLAVIEAVFAEWGGYALWENEVTEVALWNSLTNDFTDYFEVLRTEAGYYYRSVPRLTRPWTDARPPRESPLRFTEPHEQRRARLEGRLSSTESEVGRTGPWKGGVEAPAPKTDYLPPPPPKPAEDGL